MDTSTISDSIIDVIDKLSEKFGVAIDWGKENIIPYLMDLMHRYATYKIVTSIILIIVCMFFIGASIFVITKGWKKWFKALEDDYGDNFGGWIITGICGVVIIISFVLFCDSAFDLARWIYVPEVMIFKEFQNMISPPVV